MRTTTPARLVVARTPAINELLQEVWALSPELEEKISQTVYQAIVALVRERKRYKAFASGSMSPSPGNIPDAVMGEAGKGVEEPTTAKSTTEDSQTVPPKDEPHPDTIWNE